MKDLADVTCCVVDTGLFMQMARRMAEDCARVIYWNPDVRGFPSLKQACLGDGFDGVEMVREFWPFLDEIDLFCFPDSHLAGLQSHLVNIGKAVWGSRNGQRFEQSRQAFLNVLEAVGLEVPPYVEIEGLEALKEHLRDKEDKYIKLSRFRGDMETTHWRNWELDEGWLDWLAVNLGPLKNHLRFLVFDAIKTDLEIGGDTYCVDGYWPSLMLNGFEGKDKCYFAKVTTREEMPEPIKEVLKAFAEPLGNCRYRNQWSMEIRVQGEHAYFNDATCRASLPGSASQQLLWKNFPQIVWAGANGQLVEPEPTAEYAAEVMITSKGGAHDCWDVVQVPQAIDRYCCFSNCCYVDGAYVFPPDELKGQDLGWLRAMGDTPTVVLERLKEYADQLPDGLNADVEAMADVIKEIESAAEEGIPFTQDEMPKPADVL